eukprot:2232714-Rhodomonas_salina.1
MPRIGAPAPGPLTVAVHAALSAKYQRYSWHTRERRGWIVAASPWPSGNSRGLWAAIRAVSWTSSPMSSLAASIRASMELG